MTLPMERWIRPVRFFQWGPAAILITRGFRVAITSYLNGCKHVAGKSRHSRKSATTSIVRPDFTSAPSAWISVMRLAALGKNWIFGVFSYLYEFGPATDWTQYWLAHLRQDWNRHQCCQGNQYEQKHQQLWSFVHGFISILFLPWIQRDRNWFNIKVMQDSCQPFCWSSSAIRNTQSPIQNPLRLETG